MANANFDILLKFILDESSKQKTKSGVDDLNKKLDETGTKASQISKGVDEWSKSLKEAERLSKKFGDEFTKRYEAAIATGKSLEEAIAGVRKELEKTSEAPNDKGAIADQIKRANAEARLLRREAAAIVNDFERVRLAQIKSFGSRLGGASRTGLVASGALFAGVFAEANRFAKEAEETGKATRATREWTAATKELAQARARVDTVLLREALPLLQQAAEIASRTAGFIESHPELIRAALETGKIVAGLSVLGILASKGIALYADAKALLFGTEQLAAAKLQDQAATKQLSAAALQAKLAGIKVPAAAAAAGATAATVGSIAGAILANVAIQGLIFRATAPLRRATGLSDVVTGGAQRAGNLIGKFSGLPTEEIERKSLVFSAIIGRLTGDIDENSELWKKAAASIELAGDKVATTADDLISAAGQIAGSAHESEIVDAFQKWKEDDARIVQEAADQRVRIVAEAEKSVTAETAKFASTVAKINSGADKRAESITSNFYKEQAAAETRYQQQRAKLIKDGAQEIRDIQEEHQERLRKLIQDHDERVEGLVSSRDALGLAKENRRFAQEKAEENRGVREEIAKRKQQLAERLQEMAAEHQAEQAQRFADFQERLAENEAQRQEELKAAAAAHAEELKQIREQKATQLRELTASLNAELQRRQHYFIAQIRDLDAALLGERNLKNRNYALMLIEAQRFFNAWSSMIPGSSTATTPTPTAISPTTGTGFGAFFGSSFASGGYASGIVRTGEEGREFILSNRATRAAERMVGGGLTQDAILSALARGGTGNSRSLTVNDNSRFDGRISASQVREIKRETRKEILKEFGFG